MGFCYSTALQPAHADPQCSLVPNFTHCKLISGSFPSSFLSPTLSLLIQQASRSTSQSLLLWKAGDQDTRSPSMPPVHGGKEPWASCPTQPNRGVGSSGRKTASMAAAHRPESESTFFCVISSFLVTCKLQYYIFTCNVAKPGKEVIIPPLQTWDLEAQF